MAVPDAVGNFNGTTVQTLLTGPSIGNNREVESLIIHNRDTVAAFGSGGGFGRFSHNKGFN